jgi:hypothetical protein
VISLNRFIISFGYLFKIDSVFSLCCKKQKGKNKKMNTKSKSKNLIRGQRYLFSEKAPYHDDEKSFRANFLNYYEQSNTLIINSSETERSPMTQVSISFDWITKIQSLEDILGRENGGGVVLPSDILLEIDGYI